MSATAARNMRVVLLGPGLVGRAVVNLLRSARPKHAATYGVKFNMVGIVDSSGSVVDKGGLPDDIVTNAMQWKLDGRRLNEFKNGGSASDLESALSAAGVDAQTCVIDCTGTDKTTGPLAAAVEAGARVIMANKKPLCAPIDMYDRIMSGRARVGWESTVGAGTPVVQTLEHVLASGDSVTRIQGALSGTLGYLMSGLQEGKKYSDVVREAHRLGFTEPDPRDDLGGMDVARKALILSRQWGLRLDMNQVNVEPLFPERFSDYSIEKFMESLNELDGDFAKRVADAKADGKALRYVASIDAKTCNVGLKSVDLDSPLGRLAGSDNLVEFYTEIYGEKPLVVQGAGAGDKVTAAGVVSDLVKVASARD